MYILGLFCVLFIIVAVLVLFLFFWAIGFVLFEAIVSVVGVFVLDVVVDGGGFW